MQEEKLTYLVLIAIRALHHGMLHLLLHLLALLQLHGHKPLFLHILLDWRADGASRACTLLMVLQQVSGGYTPARTRLHCKQARLDTFD